MFLLSYPCEKGGDNVDVRISNTDPSDKKTNNKKELYVTNANFEGQGFQAKPAPMPIPSKDGQSKNITEISE